MLAAQFTRLFKSHAYRIFCYMLKLNSYGRKLLQLKQQCENMTCENEELHKQLEMMNYKIKLENSAQIEELKMILVRASANIARLEYICTTQEHEINLLSEKMCDFKDMKETIKGLRGELNSLQVNMNHIHNEDKKHEPNIQPCVQDKLFESRLCGLETFLHDIKEQDIHFEVLERDTEELKCEVNTLKCFFDNIRLSESLQAENDFSDESYSNDTRLCTLYGHAPMQEYEQKYVSNRSRYSLVRQSACSATNSIETTSQYSTFGLNIEESSLDRELLTVDHNGLSCVGNNRIEISSDSKIEQCSATASITNDSNLINGDIKPMNIHALPFDNVNIACNNINEKSIMTESRSAYADTSTHAPKCHSFKPDLQCEEDNKVHTSEPSPAGNLDFLSCKDTVDNNDALNEKDDEANDMICIPRSMFCCISACSYIFD